MGEAASLPFFLATWACDPKGPVTSHCSLRDLLQIWGLGKFSFQESLTLRFLLSGMPG